MTPGERVLAHARGWLDVPFLHQGRNPEVGLDCAGVVVAAMRAAGLKVNDAKGYARTPWKNLIVSIIQDQPHMKRVPVRDARPGDILLLRFDGEPQHLAFRSETGILHSYERIGKVCEHRLSAGWGSKIVQAYRVVA